MITFRRSSAVVGAAAFPHAPISGSEVAGSVGFHRRYHAVMDSHGPERTAVAQLHASARQRHCLPHVAALFSLTKPAAA